MDDLLDLDWKQPPPPSSSAATTSRPNSSTANYYAFSSPTKSAAPASPNPPVVKASTDSDAFASLFAPSSSKQQAKLSLAEAQKRAQQHKHDEKRRNDALWSGIDSASWNSSSTSPSLTPLSASGTASPAVQPRNAPIQATNSAQSSDFWDLDAFATSLPKTTSQNSNGASKSTARNGPPKSNDPFDFAAFDEKVPAASFASSDVASANTLEWNDDESILGALAKPVSDQQPLRQTHLLDPRVAVLSTDSTTTSSAGSSRVPSPASGSRSALSRQARPASRSSSPPPHIVGQIVEMGFSPAQARKALSQTQSGMDVEAALELLVGSNHAKENNDEQLARQLQHQEHREHQTAAGFRDSDEEESDRSAQRRRQHEHSNRVRDPRAVTTGREGSNSAGRSPAPGAEWQQQADQLYAQASEIGVSVFSKATAFWSSAKAQAQKALDERNRASGDERSTTPSDNGSERHRNRRWGPTANASTSSVRKTEWEGKPKWMMDAETETASEVPFSKQEAAAPPPNPVAEGRFKDSDDEDAVPESATRSIRPAKTMREVSVNLWDESATTPAPRQPPASAPAPRAAQTVSDKLKATSNLTSSAKSGYVSPNRRGAGASRAQPAAAKAANVRRQDPLIPSAALQAAHKWKEEGNQHFKRGAYDQAEIRYTKGIEALLPDYASSYCATGEGVAVETATVWLLPLLSNRANSRSKNGDAAGAIADCNASLRIVLAPFQLGRQTSSTVGPEVELYRPAREDVDALPVDVNLRESYAKALLRRAQAYEATEKWDSARSDWRMLEQFEKEEGSGTRTGSNHLKLSREGLSRCERMLGNGTSAPVGGVKRTPTTSSAPRRAPVSRSTTSAASAPLTAAYKVTLEKQQQEDTQRFELKDTVDLTIETWKSGKESNLRALLSSLHTILPPELGWQQVPLHQILDPKGLKKSYTRAITKLHPDKVRTANTQHKMLASAAFHTLNEAWTATTG